MDDLERQWGKMAVKIPVTSQEIRRSYYDMSDGFYGLAAALKHDVTKDDKDLNAKFQMLKEAFEHFHAALSKYDWD